MNFGLGDGMVRIVGAAIGPVDGASDDGSILTNEPKLRVHPDVGGTPYGRNKWTGTTFTGRHWVDLTAAEKQQTEAGTIIMLRKHGWNIGGNHNMGSQAATIVLETLAAAERQPDIKVKTRLGRNALDHNLIWDKRSIAPAKALGDSIAFGLNSELWSPRIVRGEEMLFAQYGERLSKVQPVKDLVGAGLNVHFEGGNPSEPPLWRIERFVTRTDRFQTRSERARRTRHRRRRRRALGTGPGGRSEAGAADGDDLRAAHFISEEQMLGSIERGKYADWSVLNGDYLAVPDEELDGLQPVITIVGGEVVFEDSRSTN